MLSLRTFFALVALVVLGPAAMANNGHRRSEPRDADRRNEIPTPSLSVQVHHATRAIISLQDALRLTHAQVRAIDACTTAGLHSLALATTPADVTQAQRRYLLAVGGVLTPSQMTYYLVLRPQFSEALLRLEGLELATR
jgi:hypothetical protein